jgi:selenocysteine-specific elongation factor
MTVVVGTAGHIDHGKTTLLRALTGIDADRLPEERARGMTIEVGYAHFALDDGTELDFVDVPGHERLVGNMLVGAGEIDAAMLVVAADDGPRAQTREHLEILDALGIEDGVAVVTKIDIAGETRTAEVIAEVRQRLAGTTLAGIPVVAVAARDGDGLPELRAVLDRLGHVAGARHAPPSARGGDVAPKLPRLAIDRVFSVRGRGTVVTGSLRGGPVSRGDVLRVVPDAGGRTVRVREVQVHGHSVEVAEPGRVALNVAGADGTAAIVRGTVLTSDPGVVASDRILVALGAASSASRAARGRAGDQLPADRTPVSVHLGTARASGVVARSGRDAVRLGERAGTAILRLDRPLAVAPGDRLVLRRASPAETLAGGRVVDADPPRGVARRRVNHERVAALASADPGSDAWMSARLDLHGLAHTGTGLVLADDVAAAADDAIRASIASRPSISLAEASRTAAATVRREVGAPALTGARSAALDRAIAGRIERLVAGGSIERDGDRLRPPGTAAGPTPIEVERMETLVRALATPTPPALREAARAAGCAAALVDILERSGRIVRLEPDLAWESATYRRLVEEALSLARSAPLTPARLRDATGSSRKYVMAILEDLDRRAILRRTPAGHVPGPRAALDLVGVASE